MVNKVQFRRGTDAGRGTVVLDSGEPGWTTDTKELYVGDGVTYGGILVTGGGGAGTLCALSDVSCAGTEDGNALTYQSGTWVSRGTVVVEQIPALPTSRIATGTFVADRIPTMENLNGTVPDGKIPNLETLSYGAAFATAQIPAVGAYKIASGTLAVARHETLDTLNGTVAVSQIPTMDDAHIPDLETLSYGGTFAAGQIPDLPTTKITSGTLDIVRIPSITNAYLAGEITSDKIPALSGTAVAYPLNADTVGTTAIKTAGVGNDELAASGLDIAKFTVGTAGLARIPSLPTTRITSGTFGLARIPSVDDARIPDVETLSYSATFAVAQIPNLTTSKITTGTFNVNRIETLANLKGTVTAEKVAGLPAAKTTTGTFNLNRIPSVDDARIPNLETLSYGAAFATGQIPNLAAAKITTGTFNANRIPSLPTSQITTGTFNLNRIPAVDDARIPDLETLSYGAAFATAQIPSVGAYKTASGTFGLARIPSITNAYLAGEITSDKIPALSGTAVAYPLNADTVGTTAIKTAGVGNDELAASGLDISKCTVGTAGLARIPAVDDARIPDLETLSYGGTFAEGQIPDLPTTKITSGTFGLARIPSIDDARIPDVETLSYGAAFATAQVPAMGAYKITSGTLAVARHETLDNLNGTVALSQVPTMDDAHIPDLETLSYSAAFATAQVPAMGAYKVASGTFGLARIPSITNAYLAGEITSDKISALSGTAVTTKYTDAEAVSAVATADDYLKNTGDICTGNFGMTGGGNQYIITDIWAGWYLKNDVGTNYAWFGGKVINTDEGYLSYWVHKAATSRENMVIEYGRIIINRPIVYTNINLGSTQANAGAAANEIWKTNGHATLPDNVLMIGV